MRPLLERLHSDDVLQRLSIDRITKALGEAMGSIGMRSFSETLHVSEIGIDRSIRSDRPPSLGLDLTGDSIISADKREKIHASIRHQRATHQMPIEKALPGIDRFIK
jgi:hypothetical protein